LQVEETQPFRLSKRRAFETAPLMLPRLTLTEGATEPRPALAAVIDLITRVVSGRTSVIDLITRVISEGTAHQKKKTPSQLAK
jgi:hypothetical protein